MLLIMRTTLTLDPDVAEQLRREAKRSGRPFKTVVNDILRRGLGQKETPPGRFQVEAHDFQLLPGVDPDRMNQLVDELESLESVGKLT